MCFKIKTSSPKEFLVKPNTGVIRLKSEIIATISFLGSQESTSKIHKFLIQTIPGSDASKAD